MAKLTCSKSGVIFQCEHMPLAFGTSNYTHPMFHVQQKKLLSLSGQWAARKLSPVESYLLYLALLDSTELIQWRTHAQYTHHTDSIVESNMENLIKIIGKINLITHPHFTLPSFAISPDTANLSNSHHWIQSWIQNYTDWYESYKDSRRLESLREKLEARETALQRLINSQTPTSKYATILADWAAIAGEFPTFMMEHPVTHFSIECSEYWKQIIRACGDDDRIWQYPEADIIELIEHCVDNIQHGNTYAHTLMKWMRDGLERRKNYCGFGEETSSTKFTIVSSSTSTYEINRAVLISTAPTEEPLKHQYPTHFAWLRAWTKWKVAASTTTSTSKQSQQS